MCSSDLIRFQVLPVHKLLPPRGNALGFFPIGEAPFLAVRGSLGQGEGGGQEKPLLRLCAKGAVLLSTPKPPCGGLGGLGPPHADFCPHGGPGKKSPGPLARVPCCGARAGGLKPLPGGSRGPGWCRRAGRRPGLPGPPRDRKSTRLNSSH